MAIQQAQCDINITSAIGLQDYVAEGYVSVGYIEHTVDSEIVSQIQADVSLSADAVVTATADITKSAQVSSDIIGTVSVTPSITASAQLSIDISTTLTATSKITASATTTINTQSTVSVSAFVGTASSMTVSSGMVVNATAIFSPSIQLDGQASITVSAGFGIEATATLSSSSTVTIGDTINIVLPFGVYGRPSRRGEGIIRRATDEPFLSAQRNVMRQNGTIEFINTAEKNYMYVPGSQFQTALASDDPWTLEFRFKVNDPRDSSTASILAPTRIFEYYNTADDGDTYIYLDLKVSYDYGGGDVGGNIVMGVGYRYDSNGQTYIKDFNETEFNLETFLHIAITYDGETIQCYQDGRYVSPTAGQFTLNSLNKAEPSTIWTPPSHETSEWRFGDLDSDVDDNHFHFEDIRLTKGIIYPRRVGDFGIQSTAFEPPGGGTYGFYQLPPGGDNNNFSYQWLYDDSTALNANSGSLAITPDTVFLINGNFAIKDATIRIDNTATTSINAGAIMDAHTSINPQSSVTVTARETPEQGECVISSFVNVNTVPKRQRLAIININSTTTVDVTAEETPEQTSVSIPSNLDVTVSGKRQRLAEIDITPSVNITATAKETPEQAQVIISSSSTITTNTAVTFDTSVDINASATVTGSGTIGLTVVIQPIPVPIEGTLTVSGDRIRLANVDIDPQFNLTVTAQELLEQADVDINSELTVEPAFYTRLRNTSVNITATPGMIVNTIPNVFRIIPQLTLEIPPQNRTYEVDQQIKQFIIPKQTRVNTLNKQTRQLIVPKQSRILEIGI